MQKIAYITFNDSPSGVYKSQVIDVLDYLNKDREPIFLVAFISFRNFFKNREILKSWYKHSVVIPMVPGIKNWHRNYLTLLLLIRFFKIKSIIGRGIFATNLAIKARKNNHLKKVIFDGRGAYSSEWLDFNFGVDEEFVKQVHELEKNSVLSADFRISVSNKLYEYWCDEFNYTGILHKDYEIIPCTLSSHFLDSDISRGLKFRENLDIPHDACVLIYSGSSSGWQSVSSWIDSLESLLNNQSNLFIIFLTEKSHEIENLMNKNKSVKQLFVSPLQVPLYLSTADYGILLRENNTTNKVSSPVKFAEYLSCGLDIIISENIGDYSLFVKEYGCGKVLKNYSELREMEISKKMLEQKNRNRELALKIFSKETYKKEYTNILSQLIA